MAQCDVLSLAAPQTRVIPVRVIRTQRCNTAECLGACDRQANEYQAVQTRVGGSISSMLTATCCAVHSQHQLCLLFAGGGRRAAQCGKVRAVQSYHRQRHRDRVRLSGRHPRPVSTHHRRSRQTFLRNIDATGSVPVTSTTTVVYDDPGVVSPHPRLVKACKRSIFASQSWETCHG